MPVNTTTAAIHITPVALKTLYNHAKNKGRKLKDGDKTAAATDDVFFDEAFHIVKAFIDMGTHNTIESLQGFTNTHVPAPPWAAVSPLQIPLETCNKAADHLIEWFGPEEIKTVVGGERWWQVRGLDGVDAEWITEKEFLSDKDVENNDQKLSSEDANILRMEHLDTVLLYVHGGAYFWGSINTHRYQIIRYARKIKGRAFAVNYRKAPQYPWPCPVQDVLAAYLYLTTPPGGALHKAVPPSKIVLAGDSAGAGLCVSVLTVLRDLGIEQPAGAVLISPWVDLTHSFPSVMKNTATDIIPPYGFIHKPSPIWPLDPLPKPGDARVVPSQTNPPPMPGHADTLRPSTERVSEQVDQRVEQALEEGKDEPVPAAELHEEHVKDQDEMLNMGDKADNPQASNGNGDGEKKLESAKTESGQANGGRSIETSRHWSTIKGSNIDDNDPSYAEVLSLWEPKPPKVLMNNPGDIPLELHSQIQIYASNEQLTHPLVSPVLQASLGNLCPLYIIAGDGEVLRDEIVYLAHKAAHPKDYPTRKGVLQDGRRQRENAEKFTTPTKVHLQVFDGMCHVLTVFTFTDSAKYAYRSIAEFVKYVTTSPPDILARNPFPELSNAFMDLSDSSEEEDYPPFDPSAAPPPRPTSPASSSSSSYSESSSDDRTSSFKFSSIFKREKRSAPPPLDSQINKIDEKLYERNEEETETELQEGQVEVTNGTADPTPEGGSSASEYSENEDDDDSKEAVPQQNATGEVKEVLMIRERVDVFGHVRPMEPKEEIEALHIPPRQIGIIKEVPVKRWLTGQELWDKQYKRNALKVVKRRAHYERKYEKLMERARTQGLELHRDVTRPGPSVYRRASVASRMSESSVGEIMVTRRWGPFDVEDERPAATAIVGRRDNREAVALIKKHIYFSAPVTHKRVPKRTTGDEIRAAFDPEDHPLKPPKQSVSEQQTESHAIPGMHGLHIWQNLLSYFMKKSSKKAQDGKRRAQSAVRTASGTVRSRRSSEMQ